MIFTRNSNLKIRRSGVFFKKEREIKEIIEEIDSEGNTYIASPSTYRGFMLYSVKEVWI